MTKKWSEIRRSKMPADGPVMPPCPRCGGSVLAEALELTTKREDDGKRNVCRHVLFWCNGWSFVEMGGPLDRPVEPRPGRHHLLRQAPRGCKLRHYRRMANSERTPAVDAFRRAEARLMLGWSVADQQGLIDAAGDLLLAGIDTPSLRILAGEDRADRHEVAQYLRATLVELGLRPLHTGEAADLVAEDLARSLVAGIVSAQAAAEQIWQFLADSAHPSTYERLVTAAAIVSDLPETPGAEDDLLREARAFLAARKSRP